MKRKGGWRERERERQTDRVRQKDITNAIKRVRFVEILTRKNSEIEREREWDIYVCRERDLENLKTKKKLNIKET